MPGEPQVLPSAARWSSDPCALFPGPDSALRAGAFSLGATGVRVCRACLGAKHVRHTVPPVAIKR